MSKVFIRNASYEYKSLKPLVFEIMDASGGSDIRRQSRIVIKPNLLAPEPPDRAILTHPLIVKAVTEYVLDKGAKPVISDSPAIGSLEKILKASGIWSALDGLDVEFREFREAVKVDVGKPFGKIEIARDVMEADMVINLPKLKTHAMMLLTLGVKNLFGCIVGMKKPEWHFRAGVDKKLFATLLIKIFHTISPTMTLLDGILGMEGQGPGKRGEPRELGLLIGSSDTLGVDRTVCDIVGIDQDELLTNRIARELGLWEDPISIDGDMPTIDSFKLPTQAPIVFGPKRYHGFFRNHLVQRPVCDTKLCRLCGECWKYCPAEAITKKGKAILFDYEKCIRCYCCLEVCPHAALSAHETLLGKTVRKVARLRE